MAIKAMLGGLILTIAVAVIAVAMYCAVNWLLHSDPVWTVWATTVVWYASSLMAYAVERGE